MSEQEDSSEGLYPSYRQELFEDKILPLLNLGECLILEGSSGTGKSKYLRYISTSKKINSKYFEPNKIKIFYLDLNRSYEHTTESLINNISKTIDSKEKTTDSIEETIQSLLKTNEKIYLIIDHAEQLNKFPEVTIRFLRSMRDQYKYKFAYLFSTEFGKNMDLKKLKYLYTITKFKVTFPPLNHKETIENIEHFAKINNLNITKKETEKIAEASEGYAKALKMMITHIEVGNTVDEAINEYEVSEIKKSILINDSEIDESTEENITSNQSTNTSAQNNGSDKTQEEALRNMTKSEYLMFNEIYSNKGKIVTRDQLAVLLNPENNGEGVSNESIDQLISRVRKAIKKLKLELNIKTKHGVGYYIEDK